MALIPAAIQSLAEALLGNLTHFFLHFFASKKVRAEDLDKRTEYVCEGCCHRLHKPYHWPPYMPPNIDAALVERPDELEDCTSHHLLTSFPRVRRRHRVCSHVYLSPRPESPACFLSLVTALTQWTMRR